MEKINNIHGHKAGGDNFAHPEIYDHFGNKIVKGFDPNTNNVVVVSAIKNVTRILLSIYEARVATEPNLIGTKLKEFQKIHQDILNALFPPHHDIHRYFSMRFLSLNNDVRYKAFDNEEQCRSHILAYGEIINSSTLSEYLKLIGIENKLLDARQYIKSKIVDGKASIMEGDSEQLIQDIRPIIERRSLIITQGFITKNHYTGKDSVMEFDGSDKSAGFFAYALDMQSLTFWKNIPGVSKFNNPTLEQQAFIEADMEHEAYLARFIGKQSFPVHIDGIRYPSLKDIPVRVRSSIDLSNPGTLIH